jgi:hypothetical protein
MLLGQRIHLRAPREIIRVLRATVQHHNQRKRFAGSPGGHIEPILTAAGCIRISERAEMASLLDVGGRFP